MSPYKGTLFVVQTPTSSDLQTTFRVNAQTNEASTVVTVSDLLGLSDEELYTLTTRFQVTVLAPLERSEEMIATMQLLLNAPHNHAIHGHPNKPILKVNSLLNHQGVVNELSKLYQYLGGSDYALARYFRLFKENSFLSWEDAIPRTQVDPPWVDVRNFIEKYHPDAKMYYTCSKKPYYYADGSLSIPYEDRFLATHPDLGKSWIFQGLFKNPHKFSRYTMEIEPLPPSYRITAR